VTGALHRLKVDHKARQILEMTPEAVQFFRGFIDGYGLLNFDDVCGPVPRRADTKRLIELAVPCYAAVYQSPTEEGKSGAAERATFQPIGG
jgi:hypothetical protein